MEFNRKADGTLENPPQKHVDTGMGFERLCMVLQGVKSNYDTDVFTPIIREIETISGTDYGQNEQHDIAIRVIADHVRTVAFSVADGQLPSNSGAGYVIRRILRRAVRYGFTFLNQKEPFIYRLVEVLVKKMGTTFSELVMQKQLIQNVIKEEESSFLKTLDQGLLLLERIISTTQGDTVSGDKAFELYDTYGFPLDLTQDVLKGHGWKVDEENFEIEMKKQKSRARAAWTGSGDNEISSEIIKILNDYSSTKFIGYENLKCEGKCLSIIKNNKISNSLQESEKGDIIFETTVFYAESGGQKGDVGYINSKNAKIKVLDCKKINVSDKIMFLHKVKVIKGCINTDDVFNLEVDTENRKEISSHHTSTHLLHEALREEFGTNVKQKGSLVSNEKLRFDFNLNHPIQSNILKKIEDVVNQKIYQNEKVNTEIMDQKSAMEKGAIALFGEKYGDVVRTIKFGNSIELCGGTHVNNSSDIWNFKIKSEGAIAAGIRRIEAITSDAVKDYYAENNNQFNHIKSLLNNTLNPVKSVNELKEENINLKKEIELLLNEKANVVRLESIKEIKKINDINFLSKKVDLDANLLKSISFEIGQDYDNLVLVFGSNFKNKALISCYISKPLIKNRGLNASNIVRELGKHIQGGGGGQDFFATAGGRNPAGIFEALKEVKSIIESC